MTETTALTIIADILGLTKVDPDESLSDLGADALTLIEIAMEIEDATNGCIDDEDIEKWDTVQDVVTAWDKLVAEQS